jgi:hypothetical protein
MSFEAVLDDKVVRDFIKNLDKKTKDIKNGKNEYVGLLSAIVFSDVMKHFEAESGPTGKWKQWSQSYQDVIAGKAFFRYVNGRRIRFETKDMKKKDIPKPPRKPGQILQATGRMKNAFKPTNWKKNSSGILWYNNAKTKSGFSYAFAHNEGGDILPQREFMWLSGKAMDRISEETLKFMIEKDI